MAKSVSVNDKIQDLQAKIRRLEALSEAIDVLEDKLHNFMNLRIKTEGWSEEYTDDNGEIKSRWHCTVYEEDENGDYIYDAPEPCDYKYDTYIAFRDLLEEIKGLA